MIIIEGPDGAGKSTLIKSLRLTNPDLKLAPRPCTSLGGPLVGEDLLQWLRDYSLMYGYVYDRHPCISGAVYDSVYSRPVERRLQQRLHEAFLEALESARVIYCRPPRREIIRAVNESAQMDSVDRKIHRIIDTYDAIMANIIPHERYDWTRDGLPSW